MIRFYSRVAAAYFMAATVALMLLAVLLFIGAVWEVIVALKSFELADAALDSIGLLIIGFAVIETAKFIAEEEILSNRELRSPLESRRSLTKFITIIVIAASLEARVMVFKASRAEISDAIYAAALFVASMIALVSLGAYQWLSSRIAPPSPQEKRDTEEENKRQAERSG